MRTDPRSLTAALADRYRIERELGAGGMATVYLAEDLKHHRKVAIKVLHAELSAMLGSERFLKEIELTANLQHPHILPLFDSGSADGLLFYVMPYVDGETLRGRIERGYPISVAESVRISGNIAGALDYAHKRGVIHRDIKPENVLLSGGIAVVMDFGIAKAVNAAKTQAPGGTLTQFGTSLGTPAYMAPEQAVGDTVDARADIYAWGMVAYEILAGAHPFAGKTTSQQLIAAQIAENPVPLADRGMGIPDLLSALVMRCLAKEPSARVANAADIVEALESPQLLGALQNNSSDGAGSIRVLPPRARWRRRHTLAAVAIVLIVGTALLGWNRFALLLHRDHPASVASDSPGAAVTSKGISTVAVLPFVNTGGDPKDQYFSDGMTDELAHALSRLPSLRVAGRTSSYAFRGKEVPAQQIGRTLNVAGIVEGTVRRAGNRLRITAQLTSAKDGLVVWSDSYESNATDVFQVQDQFTNEIVDALEPALRGSAATVADSSRGTSNPAAYDLYLKGKYFFAKRTAADLERSMGFFKQAIALDPRFARAHAGLAMAYSIFPQYRATNTDSVLALSIGSARRAIALDSTLGDAHLALCGTENLLAHFSDAVAQCRAALAVEPDDPTALQWDSQNFGTIGRIPEALAEGQRAAALDPLSAVASASVGQLQYMSRDFRAAATTLRHVIALDQDFGPAYPTLAYAELYLGHPDSALAIAQAGFHQDSTVPGAIAMMVTTYAAAGRWNDAERIRARIELAHRNKSSAKGDLLSSDDIAAALAFGVPIAARASIAQRIDWKDVLLATFGPCDPIFDEFRSEPAFVAGVQRLGMSACAGDLPWPVRPRT